MPATSKYDIWSQATRDDPFPLYREMRENDPAFRVVDHLNQTVWFFTRYDDCAGVLRDSRIAHDLRNLPPDVLQARQAELPSDALSLETIRENPDIAATEPWLLRFDVIDLGMNNQDPPGHTRLRKLVHAAFTPSRVRAMQPRIEQIADDLLDAMDEKGRGDLVADYALPLPLTVLLEMMGVPVSDRERIRRWTEALTVRSEDPVSSVLEYAEYVSKLIEARQQEDTGDFVSALVHANVDGDALTHPEILSTIFSMFVAGHETTTTLIANSALTLLQHPEQLERLRNDPGLTPTAIEEVLRYQGPIDADIKGWAAEPIEVSDGRMIEPGDLVIPLLLAANRDPEVFEDPEAFNIGRDPNPHLSFGRGIHACLGAPLARMEGTIALGKLLDRFPGLELEATPADLRWGSDIIFRDLKALPLRYRA